MYQKFIFALITLTFSLADAARANEEIEIQKITESITSTLMKQHQEAGGIMKRDVHNKHHGCIKGNFTVNSQLRNDFSVGAFQPGKTYPAWIRYSNGSSSHQDDQNGDGRGMAIKLIGVTGEKLLENEKTELTQDFLFINHPVFFVRNATDYVDFSNVIARDGNPLKFFVNGLNPLNWKIHEARIARAITAKELQNPLTTRYWSMTPYQLGQKAVKYSLRPCFSNQPFATSKSPDALREVLVKHLSKQSACFEFLVQTQTNTVSMPIEDPTIEWSEQESPFVKIGALTIDKQSFESPKQMEFCENLSFTPWHSLPEHRPIGGINRVRKAVYEAVAKLRHDTNRVQRVEPTGNEVF